jgi:hypothetical protein
MRRIETDRYVALSLLRVSILLVAGCVAPTATRTCTGQQGGAQLTAVYSRASKGYVRAQKPDGSFQDETYVFKNGGNYGGPRVDKTMDSLSFEDVSRVLAQPMAAQNYLPSDDAVMTKLLILVYWGTTVVPDDVNPRDNRSSVHLTEMAETALSQAKEGDPTGMQRYRDDTAYAESFRKIEVIQDGEIDAKSANLLGYTDEIYRTPAMDPNMRTLRDEVETDRYYVVLLAYDYQIARISGKHLLLWETRFSIPEPGNDFKKAFPMMASIAAKYFGQNSNGLVHHNLEEGHVEIGEPKSLGTLPVR